MSPSYPIVFYVSGHGFGHTSRTIEVIHALRRRRPDVPVMVKTAAPSRLFERTLKGVVDVVGLSCDAGMIQIDSLNVDTSASVREAKAFQKEVPRLAAIETAFLRDHTARVVVGDIPPLAFATAAAANVPSVAIGNFTWDWIYQGYPEESPSDLAGDIQSMYQKASIALRLPMAGGFRGLDAITRDIPLIARRSRRDPDTVRRMIGLPGRRDGKPLVLMSFGGYGVEGLETSALAALRDFTIATTDLPSSDHSIRPAPGLLFVSEQELYAAGLRYEDLVRAADVVVTKPGYGIISEAIANGTALLYTSRGRFVEYDVLVREMPRYLRAQFIEREDLLRGNWAPALEQLMHQPPPPEEPALNGAEVAAEEILVRI
jgi:UDP:flavonoid glycosyltransferase YjiC (YdhE family)